MNPYGIHIRTIPTCTTGMAIVIDLERQFRR